MDDETSTRYIFLFMLLPIPFLVIGLSIKALIIILPNISPLALFGLGGGGGGGKMSKYLKNG